MSSAVVELDNTLSSMLALKVGVSAGKIAAITSLCNANVKDEPVLIQKLYAHFKKAEAHKKLGVLYVIDSVTRQWVEQARKAGQIIGHGARDGTYAAGVTHVSELLPALMQDIISAAPDEQKEKLQKLIKIWDQAGTFPPQMLQGFRDKLNAPPVQSTTPTSTPPPEAILIPKSQQAQQGQQAQTDQAQSTSSILASLQALAAASKGAVPSVAAPPPPSAPHANIYTQSQFQPSAVVPGFPAPPPAMNPSSNGANYAGYPPQPSVVANTFNTGVQVPPPPAQGLPTDNAVFQQQILILQTLQSQGIPQSEWPKILAAITSTAAPVPPPNFVPNQIATQNDRGNEDMRSPPGNKYGDRRSRSRSPRGHREASPRSRYRSPRRNDTERNPKNGRNDRGPVGHRSPSPQQRNLGHDLPPPGPKWIQFDQTIPRGHIKVYSRTLFVGGVNCSDTELRRIFSQAGIVQTCITSPQKRHAFVKMLTRGEAEKAKDMFEHYKTGDMQLRTKWGVGFGPRDASDYQTGISIISLDRLTEADSKWLLTAEYGGTGGREPESGMCIEEPDIEIGGGVSSKAISRRVQSERGGEAGPRSRMEDNQPNNGNRAGGGGNNGAGSGGGGGGRRRFDHRNYQNESSTPTVQVPPTVPSFGFQLPPNFTMPQALGMPQGFPLPGGQQSSNNS